MKCTNCGAVIDLGAKFCPECGKRIEIVNTVETVLLEEEAVTDTNETVSLDEEFEPTTVVSASSPLAGYEIKREIKSGGGGTVIMAYHKNLQKDVVIKKIHDFVGSDKRRTEVDILKNLHHPNLPQVFDFFNDNGADYTVMDFVEGKSLQDLIDEKHKFTDKEIFRIASELIDAVSYLHSRPHPIIHGDIKPDNVMVRPDGSVCLIDFNISGSAKDGYAQVSGYTNGYSAPEHLAAFEKAKEKHEKFFNIDAKCDVYSIGATLYHVVTGVRIDKAKKETAEIKLSDGFVYVLNKALNNNPHKRYDNATEMLVAFRNLHKTDKRYKKLVKRQNFFKLLFLAIGIAGCFMVEQGYVNYTKGLENKYEELIEVMSSTDDEVTFMEAYDEAISLYPDEIDAYVQYSAYLYNKRAYEEDVKFIVYDILDNGALYNASGVESVYYILGNCYFELGDYEDAATALQNAISYGITEEAVYVDLAITQARLGEISEAKKALDTAESRGVTGELVLLAKGEISYAEGNFDAAISYFNECLSVSDDDYNRMRAYVLMDDCYSSYDDSLDTINTRIAVLEKARSEIYLENRIMILSQLSQAYIEGATLAPGAGYEDGAIDAYLEINRNGWGNAVNYSNLCIMYQRIGDLNSASGIVSEMLERYPEDYTSYKRAAMLEIEIQNVKKETDRDYLQFVNYYNKATELFENSRNSNKSDAEMQILDNTYKQLIDGGWLN